MAVGDKFKLNNGLKLSENYVTEQYWTDQVLGPDYIFSGGLWSWGFNFFGQLGLNDLVHRSSPTQVGSLTDWKSVSCVNYHSLAIKTDGSLWAWGHNYYGELGLGDIVHRSSPVQVGSLTNWKSVSCGMAHTVAIK